jgi:hypothetical protein
MANQPLPQGLLYLAARQQALDHILDMPLGGGENFKVGDDGVTCARSWPHRVASA